MKQFIWFSETSIPLPRSIHGLEWSTSEDEDVFTFTVKEINLSFYTKQGLLSRIATLLIHLNSWPLMSSEQKWRYKKLGWDEELASEVKVTTQQRTEQLGEASNVKAQRCYQRDEKVEQVSLHTFANNSKLAYTAVSYARYMYVSGKISAVLVTAKARVAPIKSASILHLELMAAVLGVRLAEIVSEKLKIPLNEHTLWMDSMDVLIYWVQCHSRRLKSFLANPVAEIQQRASHAQ